MRRTFDERLALIPQDRRVTYVLRNFHYGDYWYACYSQGGKKYNLYLGKDRDGQFARAAAQQTKYGRHPDGKPCGHKRIQLSCLVCIMAARGRQRSA